MSNEPTTNGRDLVDVSLWCQLCSRTIGSIENLDPHEHKSRRYYAGETLHRVWMNHQMEPEHMKRRQEEKLTD